MNAIWAKCRVESRRPITTICASRWVGNGGKGEIQEWGAEGGAVSGTMMSGLVARMGGGNNLEATALWGDAVTRLVADLKSTTIEAQIAVFDWEGQVNFERKMVANLRFLREPLPRIGRRLRIVWHSRWRAYCWVYATKWGCWRNLNLKRGPWGTNIPIGGLRRCGLARKWQWRDLRRIGWCCERVVSGEARTVSKRPILVFNLNHLNHLSLDLNLNLDELSLNLNLVNSNSNLNPNSNSNSNSNLYLYSYLYRYLYLYSSYLN